MRGRLGALNLGEVQIQEFGKNTDVLIRIAEAEGATDASNNLSAVERVRGELARDFDVRRVEIVGPQVSAELIQTGLMAVVAAIASMLIYIWFRFEWQFSVGAVLALVHDVALTIGIFAMLQLDFNLSILAAILTIVGYSMNDTVVVYDRVRENLRKYKKMDLSELLNIAINETLSRTVMTSGLVRLRRCQLAPSTTSVWPEMKRAKGEARNVAAQPSSWRWPTRNAGWVASLS